MIKNGLRTWIEVNKSDLAHNYEIVRRNIGSKTKVMAIVKSNAYGHNLFETSAFFEKLGADYLGVDSIIEAIDLRKAGIKIPILVLGHTLEERFKEAVLNDITLTISSFFSLNNLVTFIRSVDLKRKVKVHIKIDTGLYRQGFYSSEVDELIKIVLSNSDVLDVCGVYSHLSDAKRPEGAEYVKRQVETFDNVVRIFNKELGRKIITHLYASPGILRVGAGDIEKYDMVRVGALLYGIWPALEMKNEFIVKWPIKMALSFKTVIVEIKKVKSGESVGYNRSETVGRDTIIGICPIGYWHGYPGQFSGIGSVIVKSGDRNALAKVIGRVTMDMITIDLTDIKGVNFYDEVTLFDASNIESESIKIGISIHELLTRLNPKISRVFID